MAGALDLGEADSQDNPQQLPPSVLMFQTSINIKQRFVASASQRTLFDRKGAFTQLLARGVSVDRMKGIKVCRQTRSCSGEATSAASLSLQSFLPLRS